MKNLTIKVTKKHIEKGIRKNTQKCPIDLTRDAQKRNWKIWDHQIKELPQSAADFILKGEPVKPFTFKVKI